MSSEEKPPYDLHRDDDEDALDPGAAMPESGPAPSSSDEAERKPSGRDTCPNCGAAMTGSDTLVCLRCGFDLKTLSVIETVEGEVTEPEDEEPEPRRVVSPPGRGGDWLPLGIAAGSVVVMAVGYLAGADGLFHAVGVAESGEPVIRIGDRLIELLRFLALATVLTGCGLLALLSLALLWNAEFGDLRLAALRVSAVVVAMRLSTFLSLGRRSMEWTAEMLLQAVILIGLAMLLLRLNARDAVLYGLLMLISVAAVWSAGQLLTWAL